MRFSFATSLLLVERFPLPSRVTGMALTFIGQSKMSAWPFTIEYDSVCSDDGKTFYNPYAANRSGVTSSTRWEYPEINL